MGTAEPQNSSISSSSCIVVVVVAVAIVTMRLSCSCTTWQNWQCFGAQLFVMPMTSTLLSLDLQFSNFTRRPSYHS